MNQLPSVVASECQHRQWLQDIHDCKNSGLTVKEWCHEHGIGIKTYYYRLKRVRNDAIADNPDIVKLCPENFSHASSAEIIIGKAVIRVDDTTSETLLRNIFKAASNA
ncbi:MAG: hypothetical protein KBS51_05905 [Lachnospiraceae bacterium]|nr:hypothetical protein [Candidatus Darwinimomas equi]